MLKENPIIVYTADCRGSLENCVYQNRIEIADTQTAAEAFRFDSVFAQYKNDYRSKENFLWSNALPMDCDNDHSDEPTDWITPEDISFFFAGVPHIIHFSRHHMKWKGNKSPRTRFHVIFLLDPMTSEQEYVKLKEQIMGVYPYFDDGAIDSARFFIGTDPAEVIVVDGELTLNTLLAQIATNEDFLLSYREPIPEGKRNSTPTQIGACIIKRYGDTQVAYERFLSEAKRCNPPMEDGEVEQIWRSRQNFFRKVAKRKRSYKRHRHTSVFSGKIFCGDCGEIYGSKAWHSTSKYPRVIWQCNSKFDGEQKCGTLHLYEEQIRQLFVAAMSEYLSTVRAQFLTCNLPSGHSRTPTS